MGTKAAGVMPAAAFFGCILDRGVRGTLSLLLVVAACGGANRAAGLSSLRAACPEGQTWDGARCKPFGPGAQMITRAEKLIEDGEPEQATAVIEQASRAGPHRHATHVRLYEQLGKAYAFQDKEREAVAAYTKLLALSPGYLISYHVSTKATFKFEKARKKSESTPPTEIDVAWPEDLDTQHPVPLDIQVVADPMKLLSRAVLHVTRGDDRRAIDLELAPAGERKRVVLPPLGTRAPETLELQLIGLDSGGNEVALWAAAEPRALHLDYTPPTPWYRNWRYLAPIIIGGVAAIGTAIYVVARPEPDPMGVGQL